SASPSNIDRGIPPAMSEPPPPPDAGASAPDPSAEFAQRVAPILGGADGREGRCGPCHAVSGGVGPPFLAPKPDMLSSVLAYPGLGGDAPSTSKLYTKGAPHGTPGLEGDAPKIAQWIVDYNAAKAPPPPPTFVPHIEPFVPLPGANRIDLSVFGSALAGQL